MTQPAPTSAAAQPPAEPSDDAQPKPAAERPDPQSIPDPLARLIFAHLPSKLDDLQSDTQRITKLAGDGEAEPDTDKLLQEIGRTVMVYVRESVEDQALLGNEVLKFRNWAAHAHQAHADHLDAHEERLAYLEALMLGADSQLSPDDAQLFLGISIAAQEFAEQSLELTTDAAGRQKLEEIVAMAKFAQQRIDDIAMDVDDDDDDDDDASDGDDDVPPAATT